MQALEEQGHVDSWKTPPTPDDIEEVLARAALEDGEAHADGTAATRGMKPQRPKKPKAGNGRTSLNNAAAARRTSSPASTGKRQGSVSRGSRSGSSSAPATARRSNSAASKGNNTNNNNNNEGAANATTSSVPALPAIGKESSTSSNNNNNATTTGAAARKGSTRGKSRTPSASKRPGKAAGKGRGRTSSASGGRRAPGRRGASGGGRKKGAGAMGGKKYQLFLQHLNALQEAETQRREALAEEEAQQRAGYVPEYSTLVMEMMRTQLEQLNSRQRSLQDTFQALRAQGVPIADGEGMENIMERLRAKLQTDAIREAQKLREENTSLRDRLEERSLEVEKRMADIEVLRNSMARRMARTETEYETMRTQVRVALQHTTLDVERMKKDLCHRLDLACASLRTPKYATALREMQSLVTAVQEEIQDHHDVLSKLILSIGAKDTFARDDSETMHTNFPVKYREDLRALHKDNLLNVLDVLSFQDGVVDTVGKTLYVLKQQMEEQQQQQQTQQQQQQLSSQPSVTSTTESSKA